MILAIVVCYVLFSFVVGLAFSVGDYRIEATIDEWEVPKPILILMFPILLPFIVYKIVIFVMFGPNEDDFVP